MTSGVSHIPEAEAPEPDFDTSNYRKHMTGNPLQRRLIDRFHRQITTRVSALHPGTLLDAGCGEGFVAEIFLAAMPDLSLTGFDPHEGAIDLARQRNPGATFETGDLYRIAHEDDSFDVVCCFEVLEHLHEPDRALAEMARVARHAVVMSVPHEPFFCLANAARGKNWDIRPRGSDPDHRNFWSRQKFGAFAGKALDVDVLTGSFPWTICVGRPRA
ncbi:MAG: methyltransferase domain-containing protein [Chloroflexia bacterium]|nr:methyltransferase domain-containing protein [Chloroflexia bacterium]